MKDARGGDERRERAERATRLELTDLAWGWKLPITMQKKITRKWPPNRDDQNLLLPCRVRLALPARCAAVYTSVYYHSGAAHARCL